MLDASAKQGILKPIRLVLSDRQPVVLQGLRSILGTLQDFDVVASTSDGTSCLHAIRDLSPDVALIADTLPDLTASDILAIAKAEKLSTRLVFFTESDTNHALTAAIATGACSAISKYVAPGAMLRSLRLMAKSGVSLEQSDLSPTGKEADRDGKIEKMLELLTPRERQIVRLVSEGMSNKEIARRLDLSHGTVKVHLYNIFQKLEITNRTVLATISLLQRTSGFGALAVAFLAFAIADELKAADANDMLAHDDGPGQRDEHAGYEVWKKAILQHLIVSKSGGTPASTEKDLLAKAVQATDPAAAMEALRAAEQLLGSKFWKEGGAVGSGTNNLPAHLLAAIAATGIGGGPTSEHQIPQLASNSMSIHGGYGTFAAIAGALIYALNDPQLAQAHASGQATIDDLLASIGDNASTTQAAITHVDTNHAEKSAPEFPARDVSPHSSFVVTANNVTQESVQVQAGPDAAGHTLQKPIGLLDSGHDSGPDGSGRDQLMGGNVEDVVHRAPIDSKPGSSDSASDGASGPDRLNLAAFGALAWLHLTAAAKSIPPHTLAWIYDPATNQTIVYVNPTDRALDVGDHGLLEFHLQGIVAVAESGGTHPAEGVAVAVTLEQLEQALISATSTDETGLSLDDNHASESLPEAAGVWNVSADDGWNFRFAHVRTGSATSANSSAARRDSAGTAEESAGASSVTAYGSSTPPAVETLTSKNGPTNPNAGATSTTQKEIVPPGLDTAGSTGPGNSEHASDQGQSKGGAAEKTEAESKPGNGVGNGNGHHSQAPDSPPAAAKTAEAKGAGHSKSGHSASKKEAEAGESDANTGNTVHGPSQQAKKPESGKAAATEMADTKAKPGHGADHGNEHQPQAPETPPAAEARGAGHSKSSHSASKKEAEAGESDAAAGNTEHGPSQHAAKPGSGKAAANEMADTKAKPGNGLGHGKENHSQASDAPPAVESGAADHGNSGHSASAKGTEAGDSDAKTGNSEHGHPQHAAKPGSAKAATTETAETKLKPDNGAGHGNEHHVQAADTPPAAAKTAESGGTDHGHSSHSTSAEGAEAGKSVAMIGNSDHGNAKHAGEPGFAKATDVETAEAKPKPGNGPTHDNEHHSKDPDTAPTAAEPGGADHATKQVTAADGSDHGQSQRDLHVSENSAAADKQQAEHDSTEHESDPGELHRDLRASKDVSATAEQQEKGNGPASHADLEQSQRDLHEAHSSVSGNEHAGSSQKADRTDRAAADAGPAQKAAASEPRDSFHFRNDPAEPKHSDDAGVGHGPDTLEHGRHVAGNHGLALDQVADLIGPSHAEQSAFDHATGAEHHLPHHWLV